MGVVDWRIGVVAHDTYRESKISHPDSTFYRMDGRRYGPNAYESQKLWLISGVSDHGL
jgi:hypothetical protein